MNDLPKTKLRELIAEYGQQLARDPKRCKALLLDHCGDCRREVNVLVLAAEEGIGSELAKAPDNVPTVLVVGRLRQRLIDDRGLADAVAQWAVETWAYALGIAVPQAPVPAPTHPKTAEPVKVGRGGGTSAVRPTSAQTVTPAPPSTVQPVSFQAVDERCVSVGGVEIAFRHVPAGEFTMGSDKRQDKGGRPRHRLHLGEYWIGRYPVTVAQYRVFVETSGHKPTDVDCLKDPNAHPVRHVTWYEAVKYCEWLTQTLRQGAQLSVRQRIVLPSETEWEKAARGTDSRIYPWGNQAPDRSLCNFNGNENGTTPVGKYSPQGDSPYGCADMAGNVLEWTRSLYKPYKYVAGDGREDLCASGSRVLRGGSYFDTTWYVRCACRFRIDPDSYFNYYGFRLVLSPS